MRLSEQGPRQGILGYQTRAPCTKLFVSLSKIERDRRRRFNLHDCHQYRFLHRVSLCGCYMYERKLSAGHLRDTKS